MFDFQDKLNVTALGLLAGSVLIALLAIYLSRKGTRTHAFSTASFTLLVGFMIAGFYRIESLAAANNWAALIQDVTIRSKVSVGAAIAILVLNFIPFFTYLTPEDAKRKEEQEQKYRELNEANRNQ